MIRNIASRVTGTAISTARFAVTLPFGIARGVLERVIPHGERDTQTQSGGDVSQPAQQAPQPSAQEQAAEAITTTGGAADARPKPAAKKASTPKAGDVATDDDGPVVVLAVDSPPVEVEPPIDVVGETLRAEEQQRAQRPDAPQPAHVPEETEVVYSTSTDER